MYDPYAVRLRNAFQAIDEHERAKGTCERCGKPFSSAAFYPGGRQRPETREDAGLCVCPPDLPPAA